MSAYDAWFARLEAATTEAELFATLTSEQPPNTELGRAQVRGRLVQLLKQRAKEWGAGFTAAGTADAWLRDGTAPGAQLQGQAFVLDEIESWPEPVGGAALLSEVAELFSAYVHAGQAQLDALALWAVYTHLFDCFGVSPLLEITSPTHRCGKSSVIVVVRHLCPRPILSGNITPAALSVPCRHGSPPC